MPPAGFLRRRRASRASGIKAGVQGFQLLCGVGIGGMTSMTGLLQRHVDAGVVPGAVALIDQGEPRIVAAGAAAIGGAALHGDEMFRIQSMTKAITAVAALRLVEGGRLRLDAGLDEWLPELSNRRVLSNPTADLGDTVPAVRAITLRHLLTNSCGYGIAMVESPLQATMKKNGTEGGDQPPSVGADGWLSRLSSLPLTFQPGQGWRYHHSFGILGILLSRVSGLTTASDARPTPTPCHADARSIPGNPSGTSAPAGFLRRRVTSRACRIRQACVSSRRASASGSGLGEQVRGGLRGPG